MATEEQKAIWRVDRALMQGKEPTEGDKALVPEETLERLRAKAAAKPQAQQPLPRQFQPQPQLLPPHSSQINQATPAADTRQSQGGTGGDSREQEVKQDKRTLSKESREWYTFFDAHFGPIVVFILYLCWADLERAAWYAPSPKEMHEAAPHLAKLMPKMEELLAKLFGSAPIQVVHTAVMSSTDALPLMMVTLSYMHRIGALEGLLPWLKGRVTRVVERTNNNATAGDAEYPRYNEGLREAGYERPAIDPREQYSTNGNIDPRSIPGLGAQWASD